ncbi:hypothetical protein [Kordiimonas sp.]|uniref:DUF748 domain-containing protein n=1 Tax=Kordiimonas sp. TaxID=1970157 RepID=UPI003A8E6044
MKKFLLLILVLVVGGGAFAYYKLDTLVKTGVETKGPEVLKVPVGVNSISLSPFSGTIGVNGLSIGQPEGFGDGSIASLDGFDMKVRTNTLFSDHIIIDSIMVEAPKLDIRSKGSQTNFQALQKAIGYQSSETSNVTLTIKKMTIQGPEIAVLSEGGIVNVDERIKLADFTISDLGTDEKGLAPGEIARHVMDVLQPQIAKALIEAQASGKLQDIAKDARGTLEKGIGGLVGKLKKKTDPEKQDDGNN